MTWGSGYITEIDYTYGYFREVSPSLLRLACLSAGYSAPVANQLKYLELGFGQGLSINIHAAALDGEFWGTDFNPNHAAFARALSNASSSGAKLFDDSFAELAARSDLPEFDVIALHGIWSWISAESRRVIVDLIRRKLRVGGIVYLSYNCSPGWAPAMPLRELMKLHADFASSGVSSLLGKLEEALGFAQRVVESNALYFQANPNVAERLKQMSGQNRNYLAHEYLNTHWDVLAFSDVAAMLGEAKLSYVTSAHLLDHVESLNLTEAGQKLLASIDNLILRQSVRDYLVNQRFRRDIFIKGSLRLSAFEQNDALLRQAFVLMRHAADIPMKATGSLGEGTLHEQVYRPVIDCLAENSYAPKTIGQLAAHADLSGLSLPSLVQALLVLTGAGHAHPAHEPAQQAKTRCAAMNNFICERARSSPDIAILASPIIAAGVSVPRFQQLFLLAGRQGQATPAEHARFVWDLLDRQGERIIKDGEMLQKPGENLDELLREAVEFSEKRLPILRALEVV